MIPLLISMGIICSFDDLVNDSSDIKDGMWWNKTLTNLSCLHSLEIELMKLLLKILILLIIVCFVFNGCSSKPRILASFWGNELLPDQLEMTSANDEMLQITLDKLKESGAGEKALEEARDSFIRTRRISRCYRILRKNAREHYVEQFAIEVSDEDIDFWVEKRFASLEFDEDDLKEAEVNGLLDLEIMDLYLTDKEQARVMFDNTPFADKEELWQGIVTRAKHESHESLQRSIELIKNGGVKRYMFGYLVELYCQDKAILQHVGVGDDDIDVEALDWKQYREMLDKKFDMFLLESIDTDKDVIFNDSKLKADLKDYIKDRVRQDSDALSDT